MIAVIETDVVGERGKAAVMDAVVLSLDNKLKENDV